MLEHVLIVHHAQVLSRTVPNHLQRALMEKRTQLDADRQDTSEARSFGRVKPDGRRYTRGVPSNGGKRLVVRAVRDVPEIGVVRNRGYVLVTGNSLPRSGRVTIARGNALDKSTRFTAPVSLFSVDWRGVEDATDQDVAASPRQTSVDNTRTGEVSPPGATEYRDALLQVKISTPVRRMLEVLYLAADRGASAPELARRAGQAGAANVAPTLGGFGGLLRSAMSRPAERGERVSAILVSLSPNDASYTTGRLVLVPALAEAISMLGWLAPRRALGDVDDAQRDTATSSGNQGPSPRGSGD